MSRFVEVAWPIIVGVILLAGSFVLTGATASRAEAKADEALRAIQGDGRDSIKDRLTRIETILEERLPPKPPR